MINQQQNTTNTDFQDSKKLLSLAKKSHEEYLLKQQQIDLENAIDYYIRVMKLTPHISEPYYKLAVLLYNKRQITVEQALEQCKRAVKLSPDCPKAKLYYGYFLNLSGRVKQAQKVFADAIKNNFLTSSRARLALALSIFKEFKCGDKSIRKFSKALYYLLTGSALALLDYPTMHMLYKMTLAHLTVFYFYVKGFLLKRIHQYSSAAKNYVDAARTTADAQTFYIKAGDAEYKNKNFAGAVCAYKKAAELNPQNSEAILKLTTIFQKEYDDKDEELIECYNRLLKQNEGNARLYYDLGNLYLKTGDKFSALNAFKIALELEEDNPFFMNSLAYVLIQLKHYDDALVFYKKAIKINPDNKWTSIVCQAQGAIYHQIKANYEAAMTSYEMASMLDPDNADCYYSMAEVYEDMGYVEDAIEYYCKSLKMKESAKGYRSLGILLWEEDKIDESILAFEKCLYLDNTDAEAHNNLGIALLDGTGDIDRATKCFKEAIRLNPNDATAYYNLGRVYQIMLMPTKAAENFQMAINLNKLTNVMDEEEIESRLMSLFNAN
ncbi:MAG: tetratricopeptide repeat protein [bacterium]|nr:tetratricopeptide repeat protein [bacterium]